MKTETKIKILGVIDTREQEWDKGRLKGIPGTGATRNCDRCGRGHEIHAILEVGEINNVMGVSCAKKFLHEKQFRNEDHKTESFYVIDEGKLKGRTSKKSNDVKFDKLSKIAFFESDKELDYEEIMEFGAYAYFNMP